MPIDLSGIVGNVFGAVDKAKEKQKQKTTAAQNITNNYLNSASATTKTNYNPFLDSNGNLFNPMIDYQRLMDNENVSTRTKDYISEATGLTQHNTSTSPIRGYQTGMKNTQFDFNANADVNNLGNLDVATELPKLNADQISTIISKYFSKSSVIKPSDAQGIYEAQQSSGMSALAILSIGALESGYGTSSIARNKNNIWGWNATNVNPGGNAKAFSAMSQGASEFASAFMKTYYNKYGAKSINSAGTGSNPANKGYAYLNNGQIDSSWATKVNSIMKNFYTTAKSVGGSVVSNIVDAAKNYLGTPYVWGGDNSSEGGLDCSGFVYNALKDAGYNVDRTTAQGFRSYGTTVSASDMQPGDLVFFGSKGKATHIGIYIGNGQMIHSSGGSRNTKSNPGKGVSIANVNSRSDFIEARRY